MKLNKFKASLVPILLEIFEPKGFIHSKNCLKKPHQKFCQTNLKAKNQQQRFVSNLRTRQQWSSCRGPPCPWCSQNRAPSPKHFTRCIMCTCVNWGKRAKLAYQLVKIMYN